jgi:hypothetical protein
VGRFHRTNSAQQRYPVHISVTPTATVHGISSISANPALAIVDTESIASAEGFKMASIAFGAYLFIGPARFGASQILY